MRKRDDLAIAVALDDEGGLTGTMDVPGQGPTGIPLTTVTVEGQTLTMTFPVPGSGTYEGTVDDSGVISGTFTQRPAAFPLELTPSEV